MKACIIQPRYSVDYQESDELFGWEMDSMDACDGSMDLIVLPESCDTPALAHTKEEFEASHYKYCLPLLEKARETAKRCDAVLFINMARETETGLRNATYAINRKGEVVGYYDKEHLTWGRNSKWARMQATPMRAAIPRSSRSTACATDFSPATISIFTKTSHGSRAKVWT